MQPAERHRPQRRRLRRYERGNQPGRHGGLRRTDEDRDGLTDDADPSVTGETDWYEDADGDGYGSTLVDSACMAPSGTVSVSGDCDDSDAATAPGAPESCTDPVDRNCDGSVGLVDGDGDGFAACEECDDSDPAVNPGATEQCNGVDDDCDADIDEADAIDAVAAARRGRRRFRASGGRGHPCEQPSGTTTGPTTDCDDDDAEVNPGAETCNGIDDDCDAEVDGAGAVDAVPWPVDGDGDGFAHPEDSAVDCTPPDGTVTEREPVDCDDANADVNPGATELWYDGVDQDCDGQDDDQDGDGLGVAKTAMTPTRPGAFPADDDERSRGGFEGWQRARPEVQSPAAASGCAARRRGGGVMPARRTSNRAGPMRPEETEPSTLTDPTQGNPMLSCLHSRPSESVKPRHPP